MQAASFMLGCYSQSCMLFSEAHQKFWTSKVALVAPGLASLPSTFQAFALSPLAGCHMKTQCRFPPMLDTEKHGWKKIEGTALVPVALPLNILIVPEEILKLIRCSCGSEQACKTKLCGCSKASIPCT